MRTTLTIDDDVLDKAKTVATKLRASFRSVINEALRAGLKTVEGKRESLPYKTHPHKMGLIAGKNLDNIQELLSDIAGENRR
jgi:hypothetical protein